MNRITNNYNQVNHTMINKQCDTLKQEKLKMNKLYIITGPAGVGKSTISYEIGKNQQNQQLLKETQSITSLQVEE